MADTNTSALAGLVKTAYDRYVEFALRSQPLVRSVADKRPAQQAMPGSSVVFSLYNDLAAATSALSEATDPDAVALSDVSTTSVTLAEYGNASLVTRKLQLFSLSDVDPAVADIIAYNMADSLDKIAMESLRQGTNVLYGGSVTSTATVSSADVLTSAKIRRAVAKLRANKAVPRQGSLYWCGIHPEVSHDLRAETGSVGWRDIHSQTDSAQGNIWAGTIGTYEGAFFVETPRMYEKAEGANQSTFTTTTTATSASGATTITVASTSGIDVGDGLAISATTGASTLVSAINGAVITLSVATTAAVTSGATVTITPKTNVFRTILAGKQALAEAVAQEPGVVIGPVTDKLMRFRPIGWYGVLGFARYREDALFRIETSSSISD
jgi:N4-gp56 family major capsid protein